MNIGWDDLASACLRQVDFCEGYSELYQVLFSIFADFAAEPSAYPGFGEVVELCWHDRTLTAWPEATLLLVGALHAAVLQKDPCADELRRYYKTAGGDFELSRDRQALRRAVEALMANPGTVVIDFLTKARVQTNEVGRGSAWLMVVYAIWEMYPECEITLVDLGCSAGLNLAADYLGRRWVVDGAGQEYVLNEAPFALAQTLHPGDSDFFEILKPGRFEPVHLSGRIGFDLNVLNPLDDHDRTTLQALVWGDQPERLERLNYALHSFHQMVDEGYRPYFEKGDIVDLVTRLPEFAANLAKSGAPHLMLVFNSAVTMYLDEANYVRLRDNLKNAYLNLPENMIGLWLELEPSRYNEAVISSKHLVLKAETLRGSDERIILAETEGHPQNFYLFPGWRRLGALLG